jgi:hypothetical protein
MKKSFDGLFGLHLRHARLIGNAIDDIQLNHD